MRVNVQADVQPGARLEPFELVAVQRVLLAARGDEHVRLDVRGAGAAMAQHRHQRHEARAAADEQQRAALVDRPREVPADRPAQLELVARAEVVHEVRRDLAVVDELDVSSSASSSGAEAIEYERCAW